MKRVLIAAALIAPLFNPIAATAYQLKVDSQDMFRARNHRIVQARLADRAEAREARVRARLRARWMERVAVVEQTEATAEIPVPLGNIAKLIYSIFGAYGGKAVSVASCESGLMPTATNSSTGAAGLFQLMPFHWYGQFDPYDPVANTRYAYSLSSGGTNWSAWAGACT